MFDINNIIESLLFVAEEPLTLDRLKSILDTVESKEIKTALQTLSERTGNAWDVKTTALMNGIEQDAVLQAGMILKVAQKEAYP